MIALSAGPDIVIGTLAQHEEPAASANAQEDRQNDDNHTTSTHAAAIVNRSGD